MEHKNHTENEPDYMKAENYLRDKENMRKEGWGGEGAATKAWKQKQGAGEKK